MAALEHRRGAVPLVERSVQHVEPVLGTRRARGQVKQVLRIGVSVAVIE